jgi:cell wall assembly regulator SMI1
MNELLSRFDTWLATNLPDYYASLQPGVTDAELDASETKLGHKLTDDFRTLYKWRNGSPMTGFPPYSWTSWYSLEGMLANTGGFRSWSSVEAFEADPWLEWHPDWLILEDEHSGDYLLYDPIGVWEGHTGQLVRWVKGDANYVKYSGIRAWLAVLVETLEAATWDDEGELEMEWFPWMNPELMARLDPGYPKDPIEP